ncbi:hypothetical protein ACFLWR_03230 [Chloroflexota bacterium]
MPLPRVMEEETEITPEVEIGSEMEVETGTEAELQEEFGDGTGQESEIILDLSPDDAEPELEESIENVEPEPELYPEPEIEPELPSEEVEIKPEPVSKPEPRVTRKPATGKKSTSKSKSEAETKTTSKSKTTTDTKPVKPAKKQKTTASSRPELKAETESVPAPGIEAEVSLSPTGLEVTVDELLSAYEADMESANARFSNQDMRITGVVDRVEVKDTFNIYFINLINSQANRLLQGVRCVFDSESGDALNQLVIGQTVTVQGTYDGSMIDISLKECRLVD